MTDLPTTVDDYINGFPPEVQAVLRAVRATVRGVAPLAEERISYRMPALFQQGVLVYYGAFKRHLGLFPPVHEPLLRLRLAAHAGPKGNLQFPYDQPLPLDLIAAVVQARLAARTAPAGAPAGQPEDWPARRRARAP